MVYLKYLWKVFNLYITPISIIIFIFIVLLGNTIIISKANRTITKNELTNYINAYFRKYNEIVEDYFNYVHDIDYVFYRYNTQPKLIEGYISKNHGAAIVYDFDGQDKSIINIKYIDKSIESYMWPKIYENDYELKIIKILKNSDPYILDKTIEIKNSGLLLVEKGAKLLYVGKGEIFNIVGKGSIQIFGTLIYRNKMILKGSNNKNDWSMSQAGLDAVEHFLWDCKSKLNEEIINEINIKYKKPLLLERITENINNKFYKNNKNEFYEDLAELEQIGISEEISFHLWNEYKALFKEPTIWGKFCETIKTSTNSIILGIITGILVHYLIKFIENRR